MRRFIAFVQTTDAGSRREAPFEIDDDELDGMTDEEQAAFLEERAEDALGADFEWGFWEVES
jgi:hypothetical protein